MATEFIRAGSLGTIRLNRPHVLNALGPAQFPAITRQLQEWAVDPSIGAVVLEGAGERAFCAGGDIKAVWEARQRGEHAANRALFRSEYSLDRLIHRYPKPVVSLLDGIVMGGGAGLSLNGRFQVTTERTLFAMPEAAIGFFPDVGATHFLSRCPGKLGLYLGLTGARLTAADLLWTGLASHHVPSAALERLKDDLMRAAADARPGVAVAEALDRAHVSPGHAVFANRLALIDHCFGGGDVAAILARLAQRIEPWLVDARAMMAAASPTSLAVIFRQLEEGRGLAFEAAIAREYRMACAFLDGDEFAEGIRAALVDKDRRPQWRPATLEAVLQAGIDRFFLPVEDELVFADGDW